mgnify:CR=1 FL=1
MSKWCKMWQCKISQCKISLSLDRSSWRKAFLLQSSERLWWWRRCSTRVDLFAESANNNKKLSYLSGTAWCFKMCNFLSVKRDVKIWLYMKIMLIVIATGDLTSPIMRFNHMVRTSTTTRPQEPCRYTITELEHWVLSVSAHQRRLVNINYIMNLLPWGNGRMLNVSRKYLSR